MYYIIYLNHLKPKPEQNLPVDLSGRFPVLTGQGSRCSSPSRSVRAMSHLCTGCKNLLAGG